MALIQRLLIQECAGQIRIAQISSEEAYFAGLHRVGMLLAAGETEITAVEIRAVELCLAGLARRSCASLRGASRRSA